MSNGVCCIVEACCPPPKRADGEPGGKNQKREDALAAHFVEALGWEDYVREDGMGNARAAARTILDKFDLVPKGVGTAIAEAYGPLYKEAAKKEAGGEPTAAVAAPIEPEKPVGLVAEKVEPEKPVPRVGKKR